MSPFEKYISNPVEIEAIRYQKGMKLDCFEYNWDNDPNTPDKVTINTLEGRHIVRPGDWIIRGTIGEYYPCKDEVFQKKYRKL